MRETLVAELAQDPGRYDFFELVRLLEYALGVDAGAIGQAGSPGGLLFTHAPDLGFPSGDVVSVALEAGRIEVETSFLGLVGTASPLTTEWTEQVLHDDEEGALRDFYDVLHHRAMSLLVAGWKAHAIEGGFDLGGEDAFSRRLRSLAGIDGWEPGADEPLRPMLSLGLADYSRAQPHILDLPSAEGVLRRLYPDWNVRLEGGAPRFVPFTPPERTRLGASRHRLGRDAVYGSGCTEAEGLLRILVGPLDGATYESLMPGADGYARLERVTRQLFAGSLEVELEVEVAPQQAPLCALDRPAGGRLGVDARLTADRAAPVRVRVRLLQDASTARRTFV